MDKVLWPSWRYGPGGHAQVFDSAEDVPPGWEDHPSKVGEKPVKASETATPQPAAGEPIVDADGWPWDAKLHAATGSRTKAGLWRMNVGVSRPAPKPGFPKPVLDL